MLSFACSGAGSSKTAVESELRLRVATTAADTNSRRALVEKLAKTLPGEAFRHLEVIERTASLTATEKSLLGRYRASRAGLRLRLGDPGALAEFQRARKLLPVQWSLEVEARRLAFSSSPGSGELGLLAGSDRLDVQGEAGLAGRGRAARWLARFGAKRKALRMAEVYVVEAGENRDVLSTWIALKGWWSGADTELSIALQDRLNSV
jgi:hypothetical protein